MVEISKKVQEGRLRWYGHLLRREDDHVGRSTMEMKSRVEEGEVGQGRDGETV